MGFPEERTMETQAVLVGNLIHAPFIEENTAGVGRGVVGKLFYTNTHTHIVMR